MNVIKARKSDKIVKSRNNSAHTGGRKKSKYTMTNQQLTDFIASPIKVTLHGYGVNNLYYVQGQKENDAVLSTSNSLVFVDSGGGDCRSLGCLPGRQFYYEDVALKYSTSDPTLNTAVGKWSINIKDMINKAYNDGRPFALHTAIPAVADGSVRSLTKNKFMYHGGMVVHKFKNTLSTVCYMEIREFTPRQVIGPYSFTQGTTTYYKNDGLYRTLARDLLLNNPITGAATFPAGNSDDGFDQFDDKGFKYKSNCLITNSRWVVGAPVKVKLMPGETYTYKMILHPFSFNDSQFAFIVNGGTGGSGDGSGTQPIYIPGFTRHLQVRGWGESNVFSANQKFGDGLATTTILADPMPVDNVDYTEAPLQMLDSVTSSSCRIAHQRSEYHKFRAPIFNPFSNLDIVRDFRDYGETKFVPGTDPVHENVNMDTDTIQQDILAETNVVADDVHQN